MFVFALGLLCLVTVTLPYLERFVEAELGAWAKMIGSFQHRGPLENPTMRKSNIHKSESMEIVGLPLILTLRLMPKANFRYEVVFRKDVHADTGRHLCTVGTYM